MQNTQVRYARMSGQKGGIELRHRGDQREDDGFAKIRPRSANWSFRQGVRLRGAHDTSEREVVTHQRMKKIPSEAASMVV